MKEQAKAAPMREISPAGNKRDKTNPVKRKRPVTQKEEVSSTVKDGGMLLTRGNIYDSQRA